MRIKPHIIRKFYLVIFLFLNNIKNLMHNFGEIHEIFLYKISHEYLKTFD